MLFLWYCFDEWAARTFDVEWLGAVPWPLILLLHLPLLVWGATRTRK